ncbi:MAG TPA: TIR domain-containing protein [Rhizomicrobium sp.]|nr:TIR domain-containing protein [Rhizomicrobium sp.]
MAGEIFISYRRADRAWAQKLHSQLRAEGVEAWYDALVAPGEDWRIATAKALQASQIFVLLFSSHAAKSSDIAKELAAAVHEKKLIIPVRIEDVAPDGAFLYELASRNWINAFDDTEAKLAELAKGLARLVKSGARDESLLPFERTEGKAGASRAKRVLIAAAALTIIAASAAATWFFWPERKWTVESSRPFITSLALEGEPAFSPDGKMLAYTSGAENQPRQIYVRNIAGGDAIRITNDGYDDVSPSWSADGARIAYIAQKPGEPCRVMVAAVPAGAAREAGRCGHAGATNLAWRPGTAFLYYIERFSNDSAVKFDSIYRLDADSGERQLVTNQYGADTLGAQLLCSPDGKWLFFLRDDSYESQGVTILNLATGKQTALGRVGWSASGAWAPAGAWSADSRSILISASSGIGSKLIAYPITGAAPYDVYTAATNIRHLAAGGGLLAVESDPSRKNLARISTAPASQPDIIDPASGMSWSPSYAADGTLAFLSNRSGTNAIWLLKPGATPAQFFDAGLAVVFRIAMSPDGSKLAVVFARNGGITMRIFDRNGASLASFDYGMLGNGLPTWTSDNKALVMLDLEQRRDVRVEIADSKNRTAVGPEFFGPVTIRNNGTFSARFDKPGIWQIADQPRLITEKYPARFDAPLVFRGEDVLIPDFNALGGPRILAQPLGGGPDRVLGYAPGARARDGVAESQMAANPKTGEVIYVASVQGDTNIDLLTLARH